MPRARIYSRPDRATQHGLYELTFGFQPELTDRFATMASGVVTEFVQPSRRAARANGYPRQVFPTKAYVCGQRVRPAGPPARRARLWLTDARAGGGPRNRVRGKKPGGNVGYASLHRARNPFAPP